MITKRLKVMKKQEKLIREFIKALPFTGRIELRMGYNKSSLVNNETVVLFTANIPKSEMGVMAPIFATAEVEVKAHYSEERKITFLTFAYSYTHPSGSNGYSAEFIVTNEEVMTRTAWYEQKHPTEA